MGLCLRNYTLFKGEFKVELEGENNPVTRSDGRSENEGLKWVDADREQG